METFVVLLRGVMPRGKNKVPMAPLREALTEAGLEKVRTYIQSGNIIASSSLNQADLEKRVHDVIARTFGGDIAVVARTAAQFREVFERNPFVGADTSRLYFSLLASRPEPGNLEAFLSLDFFPEEVRIVDDTIYALYATALSNSKFHNNYFERKLKVAATTRNFNTTANLVELSSA